MFKLSGVVERTSSVADAITIDVLHGDCVVDYKDGSAYLYRNVSRRALFNLLNDDTTSLGFFINTHLLACTSKCAMYGEYELLTDDNSVVCTVAG